MEGKFLKITFTEKIIVNKSLLIEPFLFEGAYYIPDGWQPYLEANNISYTFVDTQYTPPTLSLYAVKIPEVYQWAFPQDKFILGGFEIPLDTHNSDKVVNIAYFMWAEFRAELDNGNYISLKRSLMPLWDYVELQVNNQNLVVL